MSPSPHAVSHLRQNGRSAPNCATPPAPASMPQRNPNPMHDASPARAQAEAESHPLQPPALRAMRAATDSVSRETLAPAKAPERQQSAPASSSSQTPRPPPSPWRPHSLPRLAPATSLAFRQEEAPSPSISTGTAPRASPTPTQAVSGATALSRASAPLQTPPSVPPPASAPRRPGRRPARRAASSAKRRPKKIRDARVVYATADEMKSLPLVIHKYHDLMVECGAIQLIPPAGWEHPNSRLADDSLFYVRNQTMPVAPFKPDVRKRVARIDEFPASDDKVSLAEFREYGREVQEKLQFESIPTTFGLPMHPKHELLMLRNEHRFFHLMAHGDNGADITLNYGVDVEAEGAFDPQTKTYDRVYDAYTLEDDGATSKRGAVPHPDVEKNTQSVRANATVPSQQRGAPTLQERLPDKPFKLRFTLSRPPSAAQSAIAKAAPAPQLNSAPLELCSDAPLTISQPNNTQGAPSMRMHAHAAMINASDSTVREAPVNAMYGFGQQNVPALRETRTLAVNSAQHVHGNRPPNIQSSQLHGATQPERSALEKTPLKPASVTKQSHSINPSTSCPCVALANDKTQSKARINRFEPVAATTPSQQEAHGLSSAVPHKSQGAPRQMKVESLPFLRSQPLQPLSMNGTQSQKTMHSGAAQTSSIPIANSGASQMNRLVAPSQFTHPPHINAIPAQPAHVLTSSPNITFQMPHHTQSAIVDSHATNMHPSNAHPHNAQPSQHGHIVPNAQFVSSTVAHYQPVGASPLHSAYPAKQPPYVSPYESPSQLPGSHRDPLNQKQAFMQAPNSDHLQSQMPRLPSPADIVMMPFDPSLPRNGPYLQSYAHMPNYPAHTQLFTSTQQHPPNASNTPHSQGQMHMVANGPRRPRYTPFENAQNTVNGYHHHHHHHHHHHQVTAHQQGPRFIMSNNPSADFSRPLPLHTSGLPSIPRVTASPAQHLVSNQHPQSGPASVHSSGAPLVAFSNEHSAHMASNSYGVHVQRGVVPNSFNRRQIAVNGKLNAIDHGQSQKSSRGSRRIAVSTPSITPNATAVEQSSNTSTKTNNETSRATSASAPRGSPSETGQAPIGKGSSKSGNIEMNTNRSMMVDTAHSAAAQSVCSGGDGVEKLMKENKKIGEILNRETETKMDEEILDGGDGKVVANSYRRRPLTEIDGKAGMETSGAKRRKTGPKSHVGNINKSGLLRHSPASPGINRPMFYVGVSGTKFCFHTEDMYLNSISYLHRDSAIKNWYVVPSKQAKLVEEYAKQCVYDKSLLLRSSVNELLAAKTTMMDPREMAAFGIDVFRVCQTPGTFVVTAPQGYHGGFNNGSNVAEAVNFANPDWFEFGRKATVLYSSHRRESPLPFEYLIFQEGYSILTRYRREGIEALGKDETVQAYARVVAKELRISFLQAESKVRQYVSETGSKIVYAHDLEKHCMMPSLHMSFGNGAGIICSTCNFKSHFYTIVCGCCQDKLKARCVAHFDMGKLCRRKGHHTVVVRRHNPYLLLRMLEVLEEIGGISVGSEQMLERYRCITDNWQLPDLFTERPTGTRFSLNFSTSRIPVEVERVQYTEEAVDDEIEVQQLSGKRNQRRKSEELTESGGSSKKKRKKRIISEDDDDDDFV